MKSKVNELIGGEAILVDARWRGNIPTNYVIMRNLERITKALKPFREQAQEPPLSLAMEKNIDEEKQKQGREALAEWLELEVEWDPYRITLGKICGTLAHLSEARESLDDEKLAVLNENFSVALEQLGILVEGE